MSFNKIENSLANLKNRSSISLDEMLGLMTDIILDVKKTNELDDAASLQVSDCETMALKLCSVLNFLNSAYKNNANRIKEYDEELLADCEKRIVEIESIADENAELNKKIKDALIQQDELQKKSDDLDATRGHLKGVRERNEQLNSNISLLSDPNLERIHEENIKLEQELEERQKKHDELSEKRNEVNKKLHEFQILIDNINDTISQLNDELARQNEIMERSELEKKGLEVGIENIRKKIKELEDWISNVSTEQGKVDSRKDELQSAVNVLLAVWNNFKNDEQGKRVSGADDDHKAVSKWFEETLDDVTRKINEVQKRYSAFVAESKKLTE